MGYSDQQAELYDNQPVLVPWPEVLIKFGLKCLYKPREVFFKQQLDRLRLKPGETVLEVGCGRGEFLKRMMVEYKIKGTGIDVSTQSIQAAKKFGPGEFLVGEARKLPFNNNYFDAVVSFDGGTTDFLYVKANREYEPPGLSIAASANVQGKNAVAGSNYTNLRIVVW